MLFGNVYQASAMTAKQRAEAARKAKVVQVIPTPESVSELVQVEGTETAVSEELTPAPAEVKKPLPSVVSPGEMTEEEKVQVLADAQAKDTLADAQEYLAQYKKSNPLIKVPKYYFDALLKAHFTEKERAQALSGLQDEVDNAMKAADFAAPSVGTLRSVLISSASEQLNEVDKKLIDFGKRAQDDTILSQKVSDLQIKVKRKLDELHKPSIFGVRILKTH